MKMIRSHRILSFSFLGLFSLSGQSAYLQLTKNFELAKERFSIGLSGGYATDWLNLTGYYLEMEDLAVSATIQWTFGQSH